MESSLEECNSLGGRSVTCCVLAMEILRDVERVRQLVRGGGAPLLHTSNNPDA